MNLAKKEEALLKEKAALLETVARNEAAKQFARAASQKFIKNPLLSFPDVFSALQDLIEPIKENLLAQNNANEETVATIEELDNILKWALVYKQDSPRTRQGGV